MVRREICVACPVLLLFFSAVIVLLSGCAAGSRVSTGLLNPSYAASRDGQLQYRLPIGWFDATADSQAVGHAVWLMRSDYGATIAVDEVSLDAGAREAIRDGGLLELAPLVISLTAGDRGAVLIVPPVDVTLNSKTVCQYTMLVSETRDTLRVTLVDTGRHVYAVTALRSEKREGQSPSLTAVADDFVAALRW
jgi:hypothetical protein